MSSLVMRLPRLLLRFLPPHALSPPPRTLKPRPPQSPTLDPMLAGGGPLTADDEFHLVPGTSNGITHDKTPPISLLFAPSSHPLSLSVHLAGRELSRERSPNLAGVFFLQPLTHASNGSNGSGASHGSADAASSSAANEPSSAFPPVSDAGPLSLLTPSGDAGPPSLLSLLACDGAAGGEGGWGGGNATIASPPQSNASLAGEPVVGPGLGNV